MSEEVKPTEKLAKGSPDAPEVHGTTSGEEFTSQDEGDENMRRNPFPEDVDINAQEAESALGSAAGGFKIAAMGAAAAEAAGIALGALGAAMAGASTIAGVTAAAGAVAAAALGAGAVYSLRKERRSSTEQLEGEPAAKIRKAEVDDEDEEDETEEEDREEYKAKHTEKEPELKKEE
mmetsp:Transcript_20512/g.35259  ORF Transcript_20512/g.35259 Transcript_20512/m.35259 type:complete len:177 (+) Transcript_20512:48-578(+)|eukprot:CAMPEP_0196652564 /NCGR_PEP_ID=MMETSP1086-20130531/1910_1 /TAXON_ID=77921 /ORGANISM="Cyanoptyche  gloeocystis , Strain SAG4.97" /LENGTH=176 /DNA_ID=CAMNT_0041983189 /DNA_START=41 /DNA_END=571 /DNA_ORIENTATION=+